MRKLLIVLAAALSSHAAAATLSGTELVKTIDGTVWRLQDSTILPLNIGRSGVYQFWIRGENPPGQAIRTWGVRMYLDCATKQYLPSIIAGHDATGKNVQFVTRGWAAENWRSGDPTGVIAAASKLVCPAA